jgi:hypothetical protein
MLSILHICICTVRTRVAAEGRSATDWDQGR